MFEAEIDLIRLIYPMCLVVEIGLWSQKPKKAGLKNLGGQRTPTNWL
jgi:hypothetical protein